MMQQYHILNGDALRELLPQGIQGTILVLRECLVDGPVAGTTLPELYATRAQFVAEHYQGCTADDYYRNTVPDLETIAALPDDSDVVLWFEDDLFCQVNFWFTVYLLHQKPCSLSLVRPAHHSPYGFAALTTEELQTAYEQRIPLTDTTAFAALWNLYREDNTDELLRIAHQLQPQYPFLLGAVQAYIESKPTDGFPGRPTATLQHIVNELQTTQFAPVFQEFCKREGIYGFGDVQVKRLLDQMQSST